MGQMSQERMNVSVTPRQKEQLEKRSQEEGMPMAEIIRRALNVHLAWDDRALCPCAQAPKKGTPIHPPPVFDGGASLAVNCNGG